MWDALQDVARNITLILDRGRGSHRKCPRCRGSGLLVTKSLWEKNEAHPNHPCWFCEGIGVLPIAGLNGFVLARAIPCLDKHKQSYKESSHLNACSNEKETIKFTKRKLNVVFGDISFDCKTSWINEFRNCAKSSLGIQQDSSKAKSSSSKWEQILQPHSSLGMLLPSKNVSGCVLDSSAINISERVLDLSAINVIHPSAALYLPSPRTSAVLTFPVNKSTANNCLAQNFRDGFGRHVSFTQRASHYVSAIDNTNLAIDVSEQSITRLNLQTKPCILWTKRRRPVRKTRNCIRDKARKEAMERARGLMRALKLKKTEELVSADLYEQSECKESTSQGRLLALGIAPKTAGLTGVAEYPQSWSHQKLTTTFQTFMPFLKYDSIQQKVITGS